MSDRRPGIRHLTALSAVLAVSLLAAPSLRAATDNAAPRAIDAVISDYVREGLAGNLALADQSLQAEQALATLQSVRARFFPEISLSARYTSNSGGRVIDLPLASLLNPAYQTLNELLLANGQAARFPTPGDSSFRFLRPHEQDTHLAL